MINFIKAKLHVNNEIDGGKLLYLNHKFFQKDLQSNFSQMRDLYFEFVLEEIK